MDDFQATILALRGDRARLRLAARVPRARHPRRDRVLVDGADGADRARPLRAQRARRRRRGRCSRSRTGSSRRRCSCSPGWSSRAPATSAFAALGGMARGRPALATVLMTTGIIALAVPGSAAFAGEFLILAGVFDEGWGWAAIGAGAIVLAAMYMLRLISAVLHQARGAAVRDAALDLRAAELSLLVPLVALLLFLSAWPASIAERAVPAPTARPRRRRDRRRRRSTGSRSRRRWRCSAPSGVALLGAVLVPAWLRARRSPRSSRSPASSPRACSPRSSSTRRAETPVTLIAESITRDRLGGARARSSSPAPARSPSSSRGASAGATTPASTTRCSPRPAPGWSSSSRRANLMTLFLGLEWFSIALYILCALDTHREHLARGGAQVPDRRQLRLGDPALRLARSSTARPASSASRQIAAAGDADDALLARRPRDDHRRARLQGLGGAVPHVDARRLPGRADAR